MMREVGYCSGVENYTRHLNGTEPGARPYTLIDYFPDDFLMLIDEAHVTIPQINAMYGGDRSRKEVLVEHGFRLPSCLDNRPLRFDEWESVPGAADVCRRHARAVRIEEMRRRGRRTGDPPDRPGRSRDRSAPGERTGARFAGARGGAGGGQRTHADHDADQRLAEDLSDFIQQRGLRCRYLHSEVDTLERIEILRELRMGDFDVLVGVNLLREGLTCPRCHSWRFWTPTKRASCAVKRR